MIHSLRPIRWRLVLTSLLGLVFALGAFYLNQWVYAFSDDECWWKLEAVKVGKIQVQKVIIKEVLPDGVAEQAGILDGDELLEIQGNKVVATPAGLTAAQRIINSKAEGRIVVYKVRRQGQDLWLPVRLVKPFDRDQTVRLLAGLMYWAIGLLVVVSSPQRKTSRHFYYLGLLFLLIGAQGSGFVNTPPTPYLLATALAGTFTAALFSPLLVHFFLRFPYPFKLRRNRRVLLWLYGLFAVLALILGLNAMVGPFRADLAQFFGLDPKGPPPVLLNRFLGITAAAQGILNLLAIATATTLFWIGTVRSTPRLRRAMLPVVILTTAVVLDLLTALVIANVGGAGLWFQRMRWIFLLPLPLMPLAFAYAILRHGFFDVRRALVRWVSYFLALGTVMAIYLGALALAFAHWLQNVPPGWAGALVGLLALPLGWILRAILLALRRGFRRDLGTAREILQGALRETKNRFSEEALMQGLKNAIKEAYQPQTLEILPASEAAIDLPAADDPETGHHHPVRTLKLPANLLRHARDNRELVLGLGSEEADWIQGQGLSLRAHVDALEVQLMVLVLVGEDLHAAVLLGGKYAELNYGREDRELLRETAIATGIVLETAVLHRKIVDQGRLEQELHTARRIQESLVTTCPPEVPGFQMALRLEPAFETGGDLLWVRRRSNGRWLAALGDVSGKGMAAALYMSQAIALLEFATQRHDHGLEVILAQMDQALRQLFGQRDFLTLTLLEWDAAGGFRLARAGHPPALLIRGGQEPRELCPGGRGLGLRPQGACDWQIHEGALEPRDWLVIYSDGLTEAMNRQGDLYGERRMKALLQKLWGAGSPRAACEALYRDVAGFEAQNRDDRTLFILARDPA